MSGRLADMADQDLAALVASRICHDLISPLGAIGNGLELLQMAGEAALDGPELALIAQSAAAANARIRFFRVAFGAAPPGLMLATAEIRGILQDYTADSRMTLRWNGPQEVQRREARLAFLAILCLEGVHPRGACVQVDTDGRSWTVTGRGEPSRPARLNPASWALLGAVPPEAADAAADPLADPAPAGSHAGDAGTAAGLAPPRAPMAARHAPAATPAPPPGPGEVQFLMLAALCRWRRPPLRVTLDPDRVTIRF